ncbi:MAG: hypothetical protein H5T73_07570 [Actinobacteria bacterium]|nr:hypothetical protein [Actinomycetota bacterium]
MSGKAEDEVRDSEMPRPGLLARLHGEWIEVLAAILLALATVTSAWSAYQAARWRSQESMAFSQANAARVHAAEADDLADTEMDIDVEMFLDYLKALRAGEAETVRLYEEHLFREELKRAVQAWKATDPLNNPDAPTNPFMMPEYGNANREEARRLEGEARARTEEAQEAIRNSDFYVLLTVLFAAVLFFAGICTKLKAEGLRITVLFMGIALFLGTLIVMCLQPVQ